jgi:hypothetical protein
LEQQVCKVNLKTGELEVVTHSLKDVGYYSWLDENKLGLFRIDGGANSLNYYEADTDKSRKITTAIGRTLVSDKEGRLLYVHKFSNDIWYIKRYNSRTSAVEIITQTKGKNEDFAMAPDGTLFMGNNNLLYYLNPARDKEWKELADLSAYGIKFISRLAVSPNGKELVLVSSLEKS